MEKRIYNIFYHEENGIIPRIQNEESFESLKKEAAIVLSEMNKKIKDVGLSGIELKLLIHIICDLQDNLHYKQVSDYYSFEFQNILKEAFLTREDIKNIKE